MEMEFVDLSNFDFSDYSVPTLISESMATRYCMIPIEKNGDTLIVAMKDPTDIFATDDVRLTTGLEIKPVFADAKHIENLISKIFVKSMSQSDADTVDQINEDTNSEIAATAATVAAEIPNNHDYDGFMQYSNDYTSGEKIEYNFDDNDSNSNNASMVNNTNGNFGSNSDINNSEVKNPTFIDNDSEYKPSLFKERLGKQLVRAGVITQAQLDSALDIQTRTGSRLGEILAKEGFIKKKVLYEFLEKQMGIPHVDLENADIPGDIVAIVDENIARRHKLVPVEKDNNLLKVAMSDPMNIFSVDDLRLVTGMEIIPLLADEEQIVTILNGYYEKVAKSVPATQDKKTDVKEPQKVALDLEEEIKKVNEEINVEINEEHEQEDDIIEISDVDNAPIVRMVNIVFNKAVASHASDIHIEPYEDCVMIRFRVDGQLLEIMKYDKKVLPSLVARIKIISGLNIAEKRVPQDGRISMKIDNSAYDMRVSVLPTMFGEKIVIRIADKEGFNVTKKDLGFFDDDLEKFDSILSHPHGVVLVTGPTGSGKSTTLYTALKELCKPNVNIMTVEDPVESTVRGVNQVQVNVKAGLTFAAALRSFLRQDPDIIMVGEIRDGETAEIAIRAAITGHLVLSTLHTNDAPSTVTRLIDMGIEPFLASSSVVGIIAQRLVRRLCPKCKEEYTPTLSDRQGLEIGEDEDVKIYTKKGCPNCNNTGYRGRIAIYEIMTINSEIRDLVAKNVTSDTIKAAAIKSGMKTLRANCARLVLSGVTTVDEMVRVTYSKE
ncbi:type II secretion system protein E [Pseudobacteroides cellulosolvens ATCC 35603 = DSM 2933]|uniref:Type II secretion system protein E n=2 Tax=Pseudobacteroides cellulosolvens TaxID=35825 RepID=A0A0L6JR04_9FIRM|nr:type II secretion system protein E [Pseudobacteroides cellulosolvens ATCC 35603 = DSM 2933]